MQLFLTVFLTCLVVPTPARRAASTSTLHRAATGSPVERVVKLLRELKTRISQDGEEEQQAYDQYACFCDKALKEKASTIESAEKQLRASGQEILKLRGHIATRSAEIAEIEEALGENEELQAKRTAVRQEENSHFSEETAELKQALTALEGAIVVLKNATMPALLQSPASRDVAAAATARVIRALPGRATLASEQMSVLGAFVQAEAKISYAPQSATVQGILSDMYATFSNDLEASTSSEATGNREFESFIALKTAEAQEMQKIKSEKEADKAEAGQRLAEEVSLYDTTEAQKAADTEYFDVTKAGCEAKYNEWGVRSALRAEELRGIEEALALLTTDDARELFERAIKAGKETGADASYNPGLNLTSFLQTGKRHLSEPSSRAYALLRAHATKAHSLGLARIAASLHEAKVGHFDEVLDAIDKMMITLKQEDLADIAKRDQCKSEYTSIASKIGDLSWQIKNHEATIARLEDDIEARKVERAQTREDIKDVKEHMAAITTQRRAEHQDFVQSKDDDQAAVHLLDQAKAVFAQYYKNNGVEMGKIQGSVKGLALPQQEPEFAISKFQAPEATFSGKGARKVESKDIISILTMLVEDLTDEIRNAMKDEEAAQTQYEEAMKVAQKLEADLKAKKISITEAIAHLRQEKSQEMQDKSDDTADLADEVEYKKQITPDCDWILGAFESRAERRASELSGLQGAKEFLAGSGEAALVQHKRSSSQRSDEDALSQLQFRTLAD